MDKKILGPLVLVVLIVGSMISWGVLEMKKQQEQQSTEQTQPTEPIPNNLPKIDFYADNVDANIHELTALYPIYGFTNETNLVNVAQSIQSLESVERVLNPRFYNPVPEKKRFMPFYAEIVPARDSNIESIVKEIEGKGILTEIEAYKKAVVKIPQKLTLLSLKQDLNISKDQNFEEPFAICTVTTDSMVGDKLKIKLFLSMRGSEVLRETMQAFVKENISAMPKLRQAILTEKISRIDRMLGFEKTIEYNGFDPQALRLSLKDLNGVKEVQLELSKIEGAFSLDLNTAGVEDVNALEQDINSAFTGMNGIKKIFFHEDENLLEARITYDKNIGYASIRPSVITMAESVLSGKEFEFIDPRASLNGSIYFTDANAIELSFNARKLFLSYGIDLNLWQQAYFDVNSLTDTTTGKEFLLPEDQRELPIRVDPGSEKGKELLIQVLFQTIRDQITAVYAAEVQK